MKNHYTISSKTAMNKDKNTHKKQVYNQQIIKWLQGSRRKGAQLDFKRALIGPQKGTFCKSIRRLLEPKRACIDFEAYENSLQISIDKGISYL